VIDHDNFIGGKWVPSVENLFFKDLNPADTRDILGRFRRSTAPDAHRAVRAAKDALPGWSATPAPKRAEVLFRSARILEEKKEELSKVMTREMGKTLKETRGDVQEAIDTAYFFGGEGRRLYGQTTPSELKNKICFTVRRPVGVVALITPWNFPLAIPSWKVYPALICGNTAVLKPAEDTPLTALLFAQILEEAGLPPGALNVITGFGSEAGAALSRHPDVDLVSFTGSSKVGSLIAQTCGKALRRFSLELGGKNAQVVMEDADLGLAVSGAVWGAFATSGQRCTATSRIYVHEKVYSKFEEAFVAAAACLTLGSGEDPATEVGPVINGAQLRRIDRYVQGAKKAGARLLCGGSTDRHEARRHGFFYRPTVFSKVTQSMRVMREEVFGPVACLAKVKDFDEAIRAVNDSDYGLSSSIYTRDVSRALRSLEETQNGITYINSPTIGAEAHLPFGGVKKTGNGHREAGQTALDIFSEWKTVYMDASGRLQRAQMDS